MNNAHRLPGDGRFWFGPPMPVPSEVFASLPAEWRKPRVTAWSKTNAGGRALESFLEGPSFDRDGNLWVVDIPNGRVFSIDPSGHWRLVIEYDGWPNGLKLDANGTVYIADYRRGILLLDTVRGTVAPLVEEYRSEGFKGVNDLFFARNGDLYFTDQGQTGWQDPTGRVFRLEPGGPLRCLMDRIPSPNGLCMNLEETQLYVGVTRANAVWRLPLMGDGGVSKVGTWVQMSGGVAGPDGLALDAEGGLVVAHPGTTVWRFDRHGMPTHLVDAPVDAMFTNVAYGHGPLATSLYMTQSRTGEVWRATMPVAGNPLFSHPERSAT